MRVAIFDLGTNTFHLLIADVLEPGKYIRIEKDREPVKLLKGSAKENLIRPDAFARGVEAMKRFAIKIDQHQVEKVFANATSAIRSASNGEEFLEAIRINTGVVVDIITGDQEAELIYAGVKDNLSIGKETALILDIGGGSNEFVLCNEEEIFWKHSFNLGAARLLEMFPSSDPMTMREVNTIESYLEDELIPLYEAVKERPPASLIGSSGSFDTFAAMISYRFPQSTFNKSQLDYVFDLSQFDIIHRELIVSTFQERKMMPGLVPMRVDMIVIASIFINFVIGRCCIQKMRLAKGALKEGLLRKVSEQLFSQDTNH